MTTNVYDIAAGLLTSDSRWSFEEAGWLVYVDDTGYDKLAFDSQLGFLFAGDLGAIDEWKQWVAGGRIVGAPLNNIDLMPVIVVDMADGSVPFISDYMLKSGNTQVEAWYGGTGGPYAKDCWQVNKCAKTAVVTAKNSDQFSGGAVMHIERITLDTNINNSMSASNVNTQCQERGIMINTKSSQGPVLVKDAANDPTNVVAQEIAKKVLSGAARLGAPFPGMRQPWTQEKKAELAEALERYAPKKA